MNKTILAVLITFVIIIASAAFILKNKELGGIRQIGNNNPSTGESMLGEDKYYESGKISFSYPGTVMQVGVAKDEINPNMVMANGTSTKIIYGDDDNIISITEHKETMEDITNMVEAKGFTETDILKSGDLRWTIFYGDPVKTKMKYDAYVLAAAVDGSTYTIDIDGYEGWNPDEPTVLKILTSIKITK
jgi:hypothetical protein